MGGNEANKQREVRELKDHIQQKMHQELCDILQQQLQSLNISSLQDLQQMVGEANREILFQEL